MSRFVYSVFTKPWESLPAEELAEKVAAFGFDAVEFPLRKGFQAEPDNAERDLPRLTAIFRDAGLSIASIAGETTERVFAACEASGVHVLRIMAGFDLEKGYFASEAEFRRQLDALLPFCEKYGVTVGVQNHYGPMVFNSMELRHLVEGYDRKHIAAIWDAAHSGLAGEEAEQGLDIIWDCLCMVNFKNAFWRRTNAPESPEAAWEPYFTTGRQGMASFPRIAAFLRRRGYSGVVCLPAEYTDEAFTDTLVGPELAYVRSLMET